MTRKKKLNFISTLNRGSFKKTIHWEKGWFWIWIIFSIPHKLENCTGYENLILGEKPGLLHDNKDTQAKTFSQNQKYVNIKLEEGLHISVTQSDVRDPALKYIESKTDDIHLYCTDCTTYIEIIHYIMYIALYILFLWRKTESPYTLPRKAIRSNHSINGTRTDSMIYGNPVFAMMDEIVFFCEL